MSEITTVGLDLAKNVFQAHGADGSGRAESCTVARTDPVSGAVAAVSPGSSSGGWGRSRGAAGGFRGGWVMSGSIAHACPIMQDYRTCKGSAGGGGCRAYFWCKAPIKDNQSRRVISGCVVAFTQQLQL